MKTSPLALAATALLGLGQQVDAASSKNPAAKNVQLGPRPFFLVDNMDEGPLKEKLQSCSEMDFKPTAFSIGHRGGGTMMIPEETLESMQAGPRMGAGVVECDVVFTKDKKLVCRHDMCDLHMTTNIVTIPELNAKCTAPFQPADAAAGTKATANCCTSDITEAEFKSLCGTMEGVDNTATTPEAYIQGTPPYRTDLYATCGTVMTHKEYIALVDAMGLQFTPELKTPAVTMPFDGDNYTQEAYAMQMIDEYRSAGVSLKRVWPQSFLYSDVLYWIKNVPEIASQVVLLDESGDTRETFPDAVANLTTYSKAGVRIVAPPLYYLVKLNDEGKIVPSEYAIKAKKLGLRILTWSLERSGFLGDGSHGGYYYTSISNATNNDGDVFNLLHVLAQDVGVLGVFSDWSATVTYYANCFGLFPKRSDWVC